jgi:hypothetical protein
MNGTFSAPEEKRIELRSAAWSDAGFHPLVRYHIGHHCLRRAGEDAGYTPDVVFIDGAYGPSGWMA